MFINDNAEARLCHRLGRRGGLIGAALALVLAIPANAQEPDRELDRRLPAPIPEAMAPGSEAPRIVGGNDVTEWVYRGHFRWMASLQVTGSGHLCGATIIQQRWALTAAHCVHGWTASDLSLLVDTRQLSDGGDRVGIRGFVIHPDYDTDTYDNDIALLHLNEPVRGPRVNFVRQAFGDDLSSPWTRATIMGWGHTFFGEGQVSDILQRTQVPIIPLGRCRNNYPTSSVTARMLCAGPPAGGRDTCQGDSGGPILARDEDGEWHQVGITSWGAGCAQPNRPGVYARVGAFTQFINRTTRGWGRACYDQSWPSHFRTPREFQCHSHAGFIDESTGPIPIGFPIRMGDNAYRELYINNNGSVTFGSPMTSFTPRPLEDREQPIIAPYWNDIDTRTTGMVYYGRGFIAGRRFFMVNWQEVPAWGGSADSVNTFQLVLIEPNSERRVVDIEFNYGQINYNNKGAQVGFSAGPGGPTRTVAGSGNSSSFVDSAGNALISSSNTGTPGRFRWRLARGHHVR